MNQKEQLEMKNGDEAVRFASALEVGRGLMALASAVLLSVGRVSPKGVPDAPTPYKRATPGDFDQPASLVLPAFDALMI